MKQLLILSGKGGTGKTTIAGAFIRLSEAKAYADCDVDAPNLHLAMKQTTTPSSNEFYGMDKAYIHQERCSRCGACLRYCRFDAIKTNGEYHIDPYACEGCGVCVAVCRRRAIELTPTAAGDLLLYKDDAVFSTAKLRMGSGHSGKLVTEVKKQMSEQVNHQETPIAIIDGLPGIGCPVIASLGGVDMALIVAEPSVSGISDMERIIKTAEQFGTKLAVCINKFDTNPEQTKRIESYCEEHKLPIVGKVPFDKDAVKAINQGLSIVDLDSVSGREAIMCFQKTMELLEK